MLSHADALICPPTLQRRPMPRLHPYVAVERAPAPGSPGSQRRRRLLGHVPWPARRQTRRVPRLSAHRQRPHQHAVGPAPAVAGALASR